MLSVLATTHNLFNPSQGTITALTTKMKHRSSSINLPPYPIKSTIMATTRGSSQLLNPSQGNHYCLSMKPSFSSIKLSLFSLKVHTNLSLVPLETTSHVLIISIRNGNPQSPIISSINWNI